MDVAVEAVVANVEVGVAFGASVVLVNIVFVTVDAALVAEAAEDYTEETGIGYYLVKSFHFEIALDLKMVCMVIVDMVNAPSQHFYMKSAGNLY